MDYRTGSGTPKTQQGFQKERVEKLDETLQEKLPKLEEESCQSKRKENGLKSKPHKGPSLGNLRAL